MELWKHYDSTHTRRHTPVHLHTRTRSLRTGPYSCIIQKGALSATLFIKKTCSEGCIQDPISYSQGFQGTEVGRDKVQGAGKTCVESAAHAAQRAPGRS